MGLFSWFTNTQSPPADPAALLAEMTSNIDYRGATPLGETRKPKWMSDGCPDENIVFLNLEKTAPLMAQDLYDANIHNNEPTKMINLAEAARAGTPLPLPRGGVMLNENNEVIAGRSDGRHRILFALSRGCTEIPIIWTAGDDKQAMIDAGYIRNPTAAELETLHANSPGGTYHEKHTSRQMAKDCVNEALLLVI